MVIACWREKSREVRIVVRHKIEEEFFEDVRVYVVVVVLLDCIHCSSSAILENKRKRESRKKRKNKKQE